MTDIKQTSGMQQGKGQNPFVAILAAIGFMTLFTVILVVGVFFWAAKSFMNESPEIISAKGEKIGIIEIKGVINEADDTLKQMRKMGSRKDIKAIIVRIDSPGGAVGASQELFAEIRRLDKVKPVVASLATIATSGGYYAAIGARTIVANPGTITGSIGVIMKLPNLASLLEKMGVKLDVIKAGKLKDLGPIDRELTEEERELLSAVSHNIHTQFIEDVATARKLPVAEVERFADGRIVTGRQAFELKLVDEIGNFTSAIDLAARLVGISGEPELVYPEKDKFFMFRSMVEEEAGVSLAKVLDTMFKNLETSAVVPQS